MSSDIIQAVSHNSLTGTVRVGNPSVTVPDSPLVPAYMRGKQIPRIHPERLKMALQRIQERIPDAVVTGECPS